MVRNPQFKLSDRIVAAILAAIWLGAGFVVILLSIFHKQWLAFLLGPFAIWYGLVWLRVAREGRRLRCPEGLIPWRRQ